jgi:osmotically-inducible protein OsmY
MRFIKEGTEMKGLLTAGIVGALLAYFLDPKSGSRRRAVATDKIGKYGRKAGKTVASNAQYIGGQVQGAAHEHMPHQPDNPHPDDRTLRDRVESEIFRDTETSRENINVEVVNGIVTVRGEQPTQAAIESLVDRIRAIPNVRGVDNLLHLPGTPAPNKVDSLRASS